MHASPTAVLATRKVIVRDLYLFIEESPYRCALSNDASVRLHRSESAADNYVQAKRTEVDWRLLAAWLDAVPRGWRRICPFPKACCFAQCDTTSRAVFLSCADDATRAPTTRRVLRIRLAIFRF